MGRARRRRAPARALPVSPAGPVRRAVSPAGLACRGAQGAVVVAAVTAVRWGPGGATSPAGPVVLGVALACALILAVAVGRARGRVRANWAAILLAELLWTAALYGATAHWPSWFVWGVPRALAAVLVAVGLLLASGVHRDRQGWGLLLLDGWLVTGSVLEITWVALARHGATLDALRAAPPPALPWTAVELLAGTTIAGLALRVASRDRMPVVLVGAAAGLALAADLSWAATGDQRLGITLWTVMIACLAAATFTARLDIWSGAAPDPDAPQLARAAHVAAVPGLLASALAPRPDVLTVGVAVSLLGVLGLEILLATSVTRSLWHRVREQSDRLDAVLRDSRDAIVVLDAAGAVEFANAACAEVYGYAPAELAGTVLAERLHPDDLLPLEDVLARLASEPVPVRMLGRFLRPDGTWRYLESTVSLRGGDLAAGMIVLTRDVEERVRLEAELRVQAGTDALTGLLNRQAFVTAVRTHRAFGAVAVLFCDLDGFKDVNDTEGHAAGDSLLRRTADAVLRAAGPGQLVARLGGDEFAVLVPPRAADGDPPRDAATVERVAVGLARTLVDRLARTRRGECVGVSIGLTVVAPGGAADAQEVLRDADLAMDEAKAAGGGRWVRFEPAMRELVLERSRLRAELEAAIADGGLSIDLQPIVDVATGAWAQFEALVRWPDGTRRRSPAEFLPLAESSGLMVPLGTWVLGASLAWLAGWPDGEAGISVNVTGEQVAAPGFVRMVHDELRRHGLAPGRLTLEITEQTAVEDLDRAAEVLQPLRTLGVHVALDDFGTGYCSLGYLAQLPVDEIKIDRRFVAGLGVRREDDALVHAVLGLAADLGLRVVAEGVETVEQEAVLRAWGCPLVQGYLHARPVPGADLAPGGTPRPAPAVSSGPAGPAGSARRAGSAGLAGSVVPGPRTPASPGVSRREAGPAERV